MLCPKCGRDNPDDSRFCNQCGERFLQLKMTGRESSLYAPVNMAGQSSQSASASQSSYIPPQTEEKILWYGCMSWKALLNGGWLFVLLLMILLPIVVSKIEALRPYWYISLLSIMPIPFFLISLFIKQSVRYRITTERLTVIRGILSRSSDDMQLVRIEDLKYYQTFLNRIFKVGDLEIYSTDKSEPALIIEGIDRPDEMKENLWQAVRERRKAMLYMEQLNK